MNKQLAVFYPPRYLPRRFEFDTTKLQGWDPLQDAASPMRSLRARPVTASGYSPFTYWKRTRSGVDTLYVGGFTMVARSLFSDLATSPSLLQRFPLFS